MGASGKNVCCPLQGAKLSHLIFPATSAGGKMCKMSHQSNYYV